MTITRTISDPRNGTSEDHFSARRVYKFTVEFPWGAEFSEAFRNIMLDLGYHVVIDPYTVNSPDDWGWYASKNKDHLDAILRLANDADDKCFDEVEYEAAINALNQKLEELPDVLGFGTDWKFLDLEQLAPGLEQDGFHLFWTEEGRRLHFRLETPGGGKDNPVTSDVTVSIVKDVPNAPQPRLADAFTGTSETWRDPLAAGRLPDGLAALVGHLAEPGVRARARAELLRIVAKAGTTVPRQLDLWADN